MSNDGKDLELLVQLIEKSIDPDATVEHNIQLPVLTSTIGSKCQCDIVIRTGKPPRETVTIVEVQDRDSKVEINDFRGWMEKLKDVGAQHLICVSWKEFPKSIKEKVRQSSNTVRLITLKEMPTEDFPISFEKKFSYFKITKLSKLNIGLDETIFQNLQLPKNEDIKIDENCFSFDKINLIPLWMLCFSLTTFSDKNELNGIISTKIGNNTNSPLWLYKQNLFISISLELEFEWVIEYVKSPINIVSYEQDAYGTLAWIVETTVDTFNGTFLARSVWKNIDGNYYLSNYALVPHN